MKKWIALLMVLCLVPCFAAAEEPALLDGMLAAVAEAYPLTEREGNELSDFEANGMAFHVTSYDAEGLGFVSAMTAKDPTGRTVMDTLVVNPFEADAPMLSFDGIYMGGSTLMLEVYDTLLEQEFSAEGLEALASAPAAEEAAEGAEEVKYWYDDVLLFSWKGTESADALACLNAYLEEVSKAPACDAEAKKQAAAVYTENLLEQGGIATDMIKAAIGEEKTAVLLRELVFGTGEPEE